MASSFHGWFLSSVTTFSTEEVKYQNDVGLIFFSTIFLRIFFSRKLVSRVPLTRYYRLRLLKIDRTALSVQSAERDEKSFDNDIRVDPLSCSRSSISTSRIIHSRKIQNIAAGWSSVPAATFKVLACADRSKRKQLIGVNSTPQTLNCSSTEDNFAQLLFRGLEDGVGDVAG